MCSGPYDYEYPILDNARYPRLDPEYGRVGSIFSDPNAGTGVRPQTNSDLPPEEDTRERIDGETDDPNFNLDADPNQDPDNLNTDPFDQDTDDVDTSAGSLRGWR